MTKMKHKLVDVLRPVPAKDLQWFFQEIRVQYIVDQPIRAQILLDRKHKVKLALSKPLGYYQFNQANDLVNLGIDVIAAACTLAMQSKLDTYTTFDIKNAVESFWNMVQEDICGLVNLSLQAIRAKKLELAAKEMNIT